MVLAVRLPEFLACRFALCGLRIPAHMKRDDRRPQIDRQINASFQVERISIGVCQRISQLRVRDHRFDSQLQAFRRLACELAQRGIE